jgi:hypothetical protein
MIDRRAHRIAHQAREVFLTESPVELSKAFDPDSGLVLIKL